MTTIKINLEDMESACEKIENASIILSEKIKSEKRIVRSMKDYWKGPDSIVFQAQWNGFIKYRDSKIIEQTSQYSKYLKGFYDNVIEIRKAMKELAKNLPQG